MVAKSKAPSLEGFITTKEVAERFGVTQHEVQRAIKRGQIEAQRIGYFYAIWEPTLPAKFPASGSTTD